MKHIYSKDFKYRKACETDIAATFRRIRAEQQKNAAEAQQKVKQLPKVRTA